jgi:hypothetical protein
MGRRFVEPQLVRIPLTEGDWLDVKKELTIGEQTEMFASMRTQFRAGEIPALDPTKIGRARALAYIVGWSFTDGNGQPIPVSGSAYNNLTTATGAEIRDALEAHEEHVLEEREAEKNGQAGAIASTPISPSVR